jgi:hypothetical protein
MSKQKPKVWKCPLCGVKEMKYGTSCDNYPYCGNKPHITGKRYVESNEENNDSVSVGIAQISDE